MNVHPLVVSSSHSSGSSSPASSMPPSPPLPSVDEVTTIFVVGFPDDMQEREFQNMFLFSKGFEAASLKWHSKDQPDEHYFNAILNKKQMIGFARFQSRQQAIDAAKEMNGKKIDLERNYVLKAEMAKKNLHIKRNNINNINSIPTMLPSAVPLPEPYIRRESLYDSFLPSDLFSVKNSNNNNSDYCYMDSLFTRSSLDPYGSMFPSLDQNPPCNTLYVGNLPLMTNEDELRYLFSTRCEGFRRMSFRQKPQGPMCFVEFEDIAYASQAMIRLQGYTLSNSFKGGIRLSYSKNPLFFKPTTNNNIQFGFKQLGTTLLSS